MKLYELTNAQKELDSMLENEELDVVSYAENKEMLQELLSDKGTSLIKVNENIESDIEAIDKELARLTELKKVALNKQAKFKEFIMMNMEAMRIQKIKSPIGTISIRESSAVEVTNEALIPAKYWREKTTRVVDKNLVKSDFKDGLEVVGAEVIKRRSVTIK